MASRTRLGGQVRNLRGSGRVEGGAKSCHHYASKWGHFRLAHSTLDLRITDRTLEAYRGTERLTSHLLLPEGSANEYRTNDADLPAGQRYQQWDATRVREWAQRVGPAAVIVVNRIFESVPVDEQGLDAALAVLRLTRRYSSERVEAACQLALTGRVRSPRYAHLQPILATGQDKSAALRPPREEGVEHGGYVRGAHYYAGGGAK